MTFPGPGPARTGFGVPEFVTARSAPAQYDPDCVPGVCVIDNPGIITPACPGVAPYASSASVVTPGFPPLALLAALSAAEDRITPPPPPAPGPCRFAGNGVPGACSGQVVPPVPPLAIAVSPPSPPLEAYTRIVPPAPPPPPPSFSVASAVCPFAVIFPAPVTAPA